MELFIGIAALIGTAACTFFLTKRACAPKSKPILAPTTISVKTAKSTLTPTLREVLPTEQVLENVWELDVSGTVKFDIKVEWSNGSIDIYSGVAPEIYTIARPIGIIPVSTSADARGISHHWALNGHHW